MPCLAWSTQREERNASARSGVNATNSIGDFCLGTVRVIGAIHGCRDGSTLRNRLRPPVDDDVVVFEFLYEVELVNRHVDLALYPVL